MSEGWDMSTPNTEPEERKAAETKRSKWSTKANDYLFGPGHSLQDVKDVFSKEEQGQLKFVWQKLKKVLKADLKFAVVLSLLVMIPLWILFTQSWREESAGWRQTSSEPYMNLMRLRVVIDGFDADSGTLKVHAKTDFNRDPLYEQPLPLEKEKTTGSIKPHRLHIDISAYSALRRDIRRAIPDFPRYAPSNDNASEVRIVFDNVVAEDLAGKFESDGLRGIEQKSDEPVYDQVKAGLLDSLPDSKDVELVTIGEPRWFPFDRYLVLARIHAGGFITLRDRSYRLKANYDVSSRLSGYVVREASPAMLERWPIASNQNLQIRPNIFPLYSGQYDKKFWSRDGIAIIVERPLFIKVITIFLGLLALTFVFAVAFTAQFKVLLTNCVGYFVGLWAVRGILTASAPKSQTLIDYGVLALYSLLVAIMFIRGFHKIMFETEFRPLELEGQKDTDKRVQEHRCHTDVGSTTNPPKQGKI
jgi:hypothetical protein